jgi:Secretion system C-terminal sorting domain
VTSIRFELPSITDVKLQVVNLYGQVVFTYGKVRAAAGKHSVDFSTQDLATGIYYISLMTSGDKATQKLMVNH